METSTLKNKIRSTIETLPPHKLKIAYEFLEDLQRSNEEETQALLNELGFLEDYHQAKEDISTGNTVSWESIKRNV